MIITGASKEALQEALDAANKHLNGNLRFKTCDYKGKLRDGRERFSVTLTVNNSSEIGSRRSVEGRKIPAACWHAHGLFFDALPAGTEIRTTLGYLGNVTVYAGDKWQDYEVGPMSDTRSASHLCNCMDWNTGGVLPFPVNQ